MEFLGSSIMLMGKMLSCSTHTPNMLLKYCSLVNLQSRLLPPNQRLPLQCQGELTVTDMESCTKHMGGKTPDSMVVMLPSHRGTSQKPKEFQTGSAFCLSSQQDLRRPCHKHGATPPSPFPHPRTTLPRSRKTTLKSSSKRREVHQYLQRKCYRRPESHHAHFAAVHADDSRGLAASNLDDITAPLDTQRVAQIRSLQQGVERVALLEGSVLHTHRSSLSGPVENSRCGAQHRPFGSHRQDRQHSACARTAPIT